MCDLSETPIRKTLRTHQLRFTAIDNRNNEHVYETNIIYAGTYAMACTNFIVGKKASMDGSVFVTYNADSYGVFMPLYHYPAAKHAAGEMRQINEWDTNKHLGEIAEAAETYNVIGNSNEWQVTVGETTFGGREEMADSTGIIDYGSLIYIALQRSKTARRQPARRFRS